MSRRIVVCEGPDDVPFVCSARITSVSRTREPSFKR